MSIREQVRFRGEPKEESVERGRYTLRYQTIDDREHPDELKAEGQTYPMLVEVFDGDELTYEIVYGFRDDGERRRFVDMTKKEIERGQHASRKRKE